MSSNTTGTSSQSNDSQSIRRASPVDIPALAALLGRSLYDDPLLQWIFPDDEPRALGLVQYFTRLLKPRIRDGVVTTIDGKSAAVWTPPNPPQQQSLWGRYEESFYMRRTHRRRVHLVRNCFQKMAQRHPSVPPGIRQSWAIAGGTSHYGRHHGYGHGYPHFDFSISPWYGGYGYTSSYYAPAYYSGRYSCGYRTKEIAVVSPEYVEKFEQVESSPTRQVVARPVTNSAGVAYQRKAEEAFRRGDFQRAAQLANHALVEMPRHGKLLLFTAQSLFAIGDYRSAAAAIHQATALLDSEQWGYVVENYEQYYRGRAFIEQMGRLNDYIKENPDADYAHFLRGYQHGFLGHQQSALRDLNKAVELESRDKLASQLIERFGGEPPVVPDQPTLESDSAVDPLPNPTAVDNGADKHDHDSLSDDR